MAVINTITSLTHVCKCNRCDKIYTVTPSDPHSWQNCFLCSRVCCAAKREELQQRCLARGVKGLIT